MATPVMTACGFHPIYAPAGNSGSDAAQASLAAVRISNIPNRAGQLLRQALSARFERDGVGGAQRYDLYVEFGIGSEGISIQQDSSVTRTRIVGTATWSLLALDETHSTLSSGVARSVDGSDVINEQFFAADLSQEAAQRRVCEAVADQITLQLASYFQRSHTS